MNDTTYIEDTDYDEVEASMAEQLRDVWRVQGQWPFPKWVEGRIVSIRRKVKPFNIREAEEAPL